MAVTISAPSDRHAGMVSHCSGSLSRDVSGLVGRGCVLVDSGDRPVLTIRIMRTPIDRAVFALALAAVFAAHGRPSGAQSSSAPIPFKVGTFERGGQEFVGLVLGDTQAIHVAQANAAFEK